MKVIPLHGVANKGLRRRLLVFQILPSFSSQQPFPLDMQIGVALCLHLKDDRFSILCICMKHEYIYKSSLGEGNS